ncbi:hypothetical protein EON62_01945, partial [archaeon]
MLQPCKVFLAPAADARDAGGFQLQATPHKFWVRTRSEPLVTMDAAAGGVCSTDVLIAGGGEAQQRMSAGTWTMYAGCAVEAGALNFIALQAEEGGMLACPASTLSTVAATAERSSPVRLPPLLLSDALAREREESIEALGKIVAELESSLNRYDAERLGIYRHNGILCSEPASFFGFLVNGEWQHIALAQAPLASLIPSTRPFFGSEAVEIRHATDTTYAAILGINAYPADTKSTMLNHLLSAPYAFVLTQSFSFLQQDASRGMLKRSRNRMMNAGDDAKSQIDEIEDGLDDIVSRRIVMGNHHFSLMVKAKNMRALTDNVALARTALSDAGIV